MTQDIADHFHIGTGVDLPSGMTVAKSVSTNSLRGHSRVASVEAYAMAYCAAGDRLVWHFPRQEDPSCLGLGRAFRPQIGRQRFCSWSEQREFNSHTCFRPPNM